MYKELITPSAIIRMGNYTRRLHQQLHPQLSNEQKKMLIQNVALKSEITTMIKLAENHTALKTRSIELRKEDRHKEALPFLYQTFLNDPSEKTTLKLLVDSFFRVWKITKEKEGLILISFFAQLILMLDPSDDQAIALRKMARAYNQKQRTPLRIMALALFVLLLLTSYFIWNRIHHQIPTPQNQRSVNIEAPSSSLKNKQPTLQLASTAPKSLELTDQLSSIQYSKEEHILTHHLKFCLSGFKEEYHSVKGTIHLFDAADRLVSMREFDVLPDFLGPMRPNDHLFRSFLYQEAIEDDFRYPTRAEVHFTSITSVPAQDYPATEELPLIWMLDQPSPSPLKSYLREKSVQKSVIEGYWVTHQIEFHNQSLHNIHELQIQMDYLNSDNQIFKSERNFVLTPNNNFLPPTHHIVVAIRSPLLEKPEDVHMRVIAFR
ncbi:MAG: hypothetical protein VX278_06955 [Myxococcota bacterium]|nr:hypothetical protein [Myxococcota bacterium]